MKNLGILFLPRTGERPRGVSVVRCAWIIAVVVGAVGLHPALARSAALGRVVLPPPPPFVNGPMALLLTNVDGFGGRVVVESRSNSRKFDDVSGQLLVRQGKLLFVPDTDGAGKKSGRTGGVSYLWDVTQGSGWLLSEALQGYAPMFSNARFTNAVSKSGATPLPPEQVEGHRCEQVELTVSSSSGALADFRVWRAADLKGFPLRIRTVTNGITLSITFSKVRLETPRMEMFQLPEGFTKYESIEALSNELTLRQQASGRPAEARTFHPAEAETNSGTRRRNEGR